MNGLKKIRQIKTYRSDEISFEKFGIGLEKLDRNMFDPEQTYEPLAEAGVKYVRLQSGWQRTEKKRGEYDFSWLDEVVDKLLACGMKPWLCLCYGNELYTEAAKKQFGAVGVPPIFSDEDKAAWRAYCRATAEHYKGKIELYEVWNEPDGVWCWKHGPSGTEYGNFVIETARAVKAGDSGAKIAAGSIYSVYHSPAWVHDVFGTGAGEYIDYITYHEYSRRELEVPNTVNYLRALINRYNPNIKIIQGESGSPSEPNGNGAMCKGNWSQDKQAKLLLRRLVVDLNTEVEFTSWFTTVDMSEALYGENGNVASYLDYGYFGILGAQFDDEGKSIGTFEPKKSYYALKNLCGLFGRDGASPALLPIFPMGEHYTERVFGYTVAGRELARFGFRKPNGASAYFYYKPSDLMTETYDGLTTLTADMPEDKVRLVDPMDGAVYEIPEDMKKREGGVYILDEIPVRDYPLVLTFGDFFEEE